MSDKEEDVIFDPGYEVVTPKNTYVVERLLGEGGFGAVYLMNAKNKQGKEVQYAMKVEGFKVERRHSKLKMEIAILKTVGDSKHFTKIIDRGKREQEKYYFLVMELVGKSLGDLKAEHGKPFSFATGIGAGSQCLEAVQELHKLGYIHRDLKPANYACGLDKKKHMIYILDFGIARKYINKKNELKTPREKVGFKGTIRYASIACHKGVEMGPKDDVECILYLIVEFLSEVGLPWKKEKEREEVQKIKEECRTTRRTEFFEGIKRTNELIKIMEYLASIAYQDHVDYTYIYKMLEESCRQAKVDINGLYDWEKERFGENEEKDKTEKPDEGKKDEEVKKKDEDVKKKEKKEEKKTKKEKEKEKDKGNTK